MYVISLYLTPNWVPIMNLFPYAWILGVMNSCSDLYLLSAMRPFMAASIFEATEVALSGSLSAIASSHVPCKGCFYSPH